VAAFLKISATSEILSPTAEMLLFVVALPDPRPRKTPAHASSSGSSRLYDQEVMVAVLGGSRPNPFCECTIVGLRTTFYIVICDIMTTFE